MLESDIEEKCKIYAHNKGFLHLKLNVSGQRGWPDHLFLYRSVVFFVEFKLPGEKPDPIQMEIHRQLERHGFVVEVVDSYEVFKDFIDCLLEVMP